MPFSKRKPKLSTLLPPRIRGLEAYTTPLVPNFSKSWFSIGTIPAADAAIDAADAIAMTTRFVLI